MREMLHVVCGDMPLAVINFYIIASHDSMICMKIHIKLFTFMLGLMNVNALNCS